MDSKGRTAAQSTLDELMSQEEEAAGSAPSTVNQLPSDDANGDEELESMNGRVDFFYVHEFKPNSKFASKQIEEGQEIQGTYKGSYTSGPHDSRTHKIYVTAGPEAGKTVGLPSCQALDQEFQFTPEETTTLTICKGKVIAKTGFRKGKYVFSYDVKRPKSVNTKIRLKQIPANYELKKRDK